MKLSVSWGVSCPSWWPKPRGRSGGFCCLYHIPWNSTEPAQAGATIPIKGFLFFSGIGVAPTCCMPSFGTFLVPIDVCWFPHFSHNAGLEVKASSLRTFPTAAAGGSLHLCAPKSHWDFALGWPGGFSIPSVGIWGLAQPFLLPACLLILCRVNTFPLLYHLTKNLKDKQKKQERNKPRHPPINSMHQGKHRKH